MASKASRRKFRAILIGPVLARGAGLRRELAQLGYAESDLLIGVDGGVDHLFRAGIEPRLAIGDWDSLSPRSRARALAGKHLTLSRDKDRSDLYYAAALAAEAGATEIICLGVTGGRPDHHLAALFDLADVADKAPGLRSVRVMGRDAEYVFIGASGGFRGVPYRRALPRGALVSIFSPLGKSRGVTLRGFEYALRDAILEPSSRGLSNRVTRGSCEIRLREGTLLLVIPSRMP